MRRSILLHIFCVVNLAAGIYPWLQAGDNQLPVISSPASAAPNPGIAGQSVVFSVGATDPDGDALSISWSYGDGASDATGSHTYSVAGQYSATATVNDGQGGSVTSSTTVTINPAPPVITSRLAAYPNNAKPGQVVVFTLSATSPSGNPLSFRFDYGDGTSGTTERHTYNAAGWYGASVKVTDVKTGASVISTAVVLVGDEPPVITAQLKAWPSSTIVGQQILFTIAASDPDGDPLVVHWDYGDGTSGDVETHTYPLPGNYVVAAIVSDGKGGLNVSTTTVSVAGGVGNGSNPNAPIAPPPVAGGPVAPGSTPPVITAQVHAYPSVASPGQEVLFSIGISDPDPVTVSWNYGDGSSGNIERHTYTKAGPYAVVASVIDAKGNTATSSTVVLVADAPPVISSPLKAWPSRVAAGKKVLFTIHAVDPDNDPVTVEWFYGDGTSGNIEVHKYDTAGIYTPLALVSDGNGGMAVSTTTVIVMAPTASRTQRRTPKAK
jgi:PKD repeat protein